MPPRHTKRREHRLESTLVFQTTQGSRASGFGGSILIISISNIIPAVVSIMYLLAESHPSRVPLTLQRRLTEQLHMGVAKHEIFPAKNGNSDVLMLVPRGPSTRGPQVSEIPTLVLDCVEYHTVHPQICAKSTWLQACWLRVHYH